MKKGDMAVFMLASRLGYGATGRNGVPPNCVIQFEVDLISWITVVDVCKDGGIIKKVIEKGEQIGPLPSQFLPKSEIRNLNKLWHPWEREKVEYFTLADLWNSFDEWSTYGAYVPLFAIQIFTSNSSANSLREETESVSEMRDSFSDSFNDESESEKLSRWDGCSSEDGVFEQESLWHLNDRLGYL